MVTFLEHAVRIAGAMNRQGLWDEEDGFYYDTLRLPDGSSVPLRIHSMIGLLPILPAVTVPRQAAELGQALGKRFARFLQNAGMSEAQVRARGSIVPSAGGESLLLSLLPPVHLERVLRIALSEDEFLSPYGLRALSRRHQDQPFSITIEGVEASIDYEPGESTNNLFGGNSNWRGPVWFPVNFLFIESLMRWDEGLGEAFTVEYPTGSGTRLRLRDVAADLAQRLVSIWLPDAAGHRPVAGTAAKLRDDPEWRDLLLFHEYFHGDTGTGIGASHQTGWTGLVAHLLVRGGTLDIAANGRPTHEPAPAGPPTPGRRDRGHVMTHGSDPEGRTMDAETLSRVQFAFTASFHFIFPPLSMGLGFMLLVVSGVYLRTKDPKWRQLAFFWTKVYGLIFALGVATGVVQEFEFGMNWADYSRFVGNVFGSLLAAEGVFAFFLEGGFLGLMLFGGNRLGPKLWFFATFMVVFGAHFSALWILMANSWMQTPQGYEVVNDPAPARAVMTDFWEVIWTPSFPPRLLHVFVASWTAGSALMLSVSAWYLLKKRHVELARANFSLALPFFIVFAITNVAVFGASMAIEVTHEQPIKLASMEGLWQGTTCAPLYIVGWVDVATQTTNGISIPCLLSVLAYFNPQAYVTGLNDFPGQPLPPIALLFQVYHLMFGLGTLFAGSGCWVASLLPQAGEEGDAIARGDLGRAVDSPAVRGHRVLRRGRDHRRLVDRRDRAPAVGRLQRPAHSGRRVTVVERGRRHRIAGDVPRPVRAPARAVPVPAQRQDPAWPGAPGGSRDGRCGKPARHVPRRVQEARPG